MDFRNQVLLCPLIGLEMEVVSSSSRELIGTKGKIIDETKNLVVVEKGKDVRNIVKKGNVFEVKFMGKKVKINGDGIVYRPEEKAKNIKIR